MRALAGVVLVLLQVGLAAEARAGAPDPADEAEVPAPGPGGNSVLTGDWGGARTRAEAGGVKLDLEATLFYQGLVSGTHPHENEFGGRLDGFIKLDTTKLGWWDGGGFVTHLEYRSGDLPSRLGGTFFPTNSGMEFPSNSPDELVATSLYFSQRFGDRTSLMVGKINALDLLENDLYFGGWGIRRSWNSVWVAPPTGLIPPVFIGAMGSYRTDSGSLSLWIYDPADRTDDYFPGDLFETGVTFYLTPSWNFALQGRSTSLSLAGVYTTETGVDYSSIGGDYEEGLQPATKQGSWNVNVQFMHMLDVNTANPRQGWGVYVKAAVSDGNPNYVQRSLITGIGGTGLFEGRDLDSFGLGYFYYDLSDALQDALSPILGPLGDERGAEAYYSYALTPWCHLTGDLQYVTPPRNSLEDAFIAGLRLNLRF